MIKVAQQMRELIVKAAYYAKHGHMPSALSIVEVLAVYNKIKTDKDIFVLSKGHGSLALYSLLVIQGEITESELFNFGNNGSKLGGHPDRNKLNSIYASTGSLGHGFPIAVGSALARKIMNSPGKVFCLIGDGECNEGTIWESLQIAANNNLQNLICIVDVNNSQTRSLPMNNLFHKFSSFGWNVVEVDGHNIEDVNRAMSTDSDKPLAIIANTVKGKGIADIEKDMFAWHHRAPSDNEYKKFIEEIHEK
tara:strand:+ start:3714 stop:4463 length:750 start_codon:yes stop_codon:yes gene_type:complete